MEKHATLSDIAKIAKLAKGTVSMALNNDSRISAETRKKVQKIAEKLNYYPNESAKKLATGNTDSIAFISMKFTASFYSSILSAVEDRAFKTGKYMHGITPYSTRNILSVKENLLKKILYGRKADAVVLFTSKPSVEIVQQYIKNRIPLILVENEMKGVHSVKLDDFSGAYKATDYLIKKYGKNVGIIIGETQPPLGEEAHYPSIERLKGYKKALSDNMLEFDKNYVKYVRNYSYDDGRESTLSFLRAKTPIRSLFCAAGDVTAIGAIDQLKKENIRVPQDIPVIGYDDILAAKFLNPALTTVRQPLEELGNIIFDIAIDSIEGKITEEKHIKIEPELIKRESA